MIEPDGELIVYNRLSDLVAKKGKGFAVPLASRTVALPPKAGGLTASGTLNGAVAHDPTLSYDVAGTPPGKITPCCASKSFRERKGPRSNLSPRFEAGVRSSLSSINPARNDLTRSTNTWSSR